METASSEKVINTGEEKIVETVCQGCHVTCGVLVHVSDGKITKIEGNPEHPLSRGMMCPKGLAYKQIVHHPDRLKYPLKRVGERGEDKWQRISWDEALDTIAEKFKDAREKYGPESIVAVAGGNPRRNMHATRALMDSIGSPNWSTADAPFCWGPSVAAEHFTYGCHVTQDIGSDCKHSKCVIVWAGNPVNTHPTWARDLMLAKANGARIIVIDPRFTVTASKADNWLQIRPGTDGALALGMLNLVINEELYDKEFVDKWCLGFNELKKRV